MNIIKIPKHPNYTAKVTYKSTPEDKGRCLEFAKKVAPTVLPKYQERAAKGEVVTLESVTYQIYYSKLAEFAAMQFLIDNGFKVAEPDTEVYEIKDKSFSADLKATHDKLEGIDNLTVHVKSQPSDGIKVTRKTPSWGFTNVDKLLRNPKKSDYVLMIVVDDDRYFNIVGMVAARYIFPRFIDSYENGSKQRSAIYLRDMKNAVAAGTFYV